MRPGDRPVPNYEVRPCMLNGVWATLTDIIHEFAESRSPKRHERFRRDALACIEAYLHDPCLCDGCCASGEIARLERHRAELVAECP